MTRDEKRTLLGNHQVELMEKTGEPAMLVCYGDDLGDPGYCATIQHGDTVICHWFSHAQTFTGVDGWLERQVTAMEALDELQERLEQTERT